MGMGRDVKRSFAGVTFAASRMLPRYRMINENSSIGAAFQAFYVRKARQYWSFRQFRRYLLHQLLEFAKLKEFFLTLLHDFVRRFFGERFQ